MIKLKTTERMKQYAESRTKTVRFNIPVAFERKYRLESDMKLLASWNYEALKPHATVARWEQFEDSTSVNCKQMCSEFQFCHLPSGEFWDHVSSRKVKWREGDVLRICEGGPLLETILHHLRVLSEGEKSCIKARKLSVFDRDTKERPSSIQRANTDIKMIEETVKISITYFAPSSAELSCIIASDNSLSIGSPEYSRQTVIRNFDVIDNERSGLNYLEPNVTLDPLNVEHADDLRLNVKVSNERSNNSKQHLTKCDKSVRSTQDIEAENPSVIDVPESVDANSDLSNCPASDAQETNAVEFIEKQTDSAAICLSTDAVKSANLQTATNTRPAPGVKTQDEQTSVQTSSEPIAETSDLPPGTVPPLNKWANIAESRVVFMSTARKPASETLDEAKNKIATVNNMETGNSDNQKKQIKSSYYCSQSTSYQKPMYNRKNLKDEYENEQLDFDFGTKTPDFNTRENDCILRDPQDRLVGYPSNNNISIKTVQRERRDKETRQSSKLLARVSILRSTDQKAKSAGVAKNITDELPTQSTNNSRQFNEPMTKLCPVTHRKTHDARSLSEAQCPNPAPSTKTTTHLLPSVNTTHNLALLTNCRPRLNHMPVTFTSRDYDDISKRRDTVVARRFDVSRLPRVSRRPETLAQLYRGKLHQLRHAHDDDILCTNQSDANTDDDADGEYSALQTNGEPLPVISRHLMSMAKRRGGGGAGGAGGGKGGKTKAGTATAAAGTGRTLLRVYNRRRRARDTAERRRAVSPFTGVTSPVDVTDYRDIKLRDSVRPPDSKWRLGRMSRCKLSRRVCDTESGSLCVAIHRDSNTNAVATSDEQDQGMTSNNDKATPESAYMTHKKACMKPNSAYKTPNSAYMNADEKARFSERLLDAFTHFTIRKEQLTRIDGQDRRTITSVTMTLKCDGASLECEVDPGVY